MSRRKWTVLGLLLLVLVCCGLLPCTQQVLDGEGWTGSAASLRTVGAALRAYHIKNGKLPPAVVYGKGGEPLYSWRVQRL
jgi:hypothetical protein